MQRPSVTVHYAQSLDGRIATRRGDSQWIGGPGSLRFAHELRAGHDAVLVGIGTVLADDPRLTVRLVPGASPLRVVVDSTLRVPLDANVLVDGAATTVIATTRRATPERIAAVGRRGAEVVVVDQNGANRVDLGCLLAQLRDRGHTTLLIEGGGGVITSALRQRLVDRIVVCIAPLVLGAGIDAIGDLAIERLRDGLGFTSATFRPLGDDVIFDGQLAPDPAS